MKADDAQSILIADLVKTYAPSSAVKKLVSETPVVLLVGISGAGKDTIKHHLMATKQYHHVVSHTTRSMRENEGVMEQDGVEYHFISIEAAINMLKNGEFVEAKEYSGNIYGTSAAEIQWAKDAGEIAITDLEVQGVAEYKSISENVIAIFVLPPDFKEWQRRLKSRYGNKGADPTDMQKRMHTAIMELQDALKQDYYHFVINDDLDVAVAIIDKIAHNHDKFNSIDENVRSKAIQLLADLSSNI